MLAQEFTPRKFFTHENLDFYQRHRADNRKEDTKKLPTTNGLDDSFHYAISPVAKFVQFLFIMPVIGVSEAVPKGLKFKWKTFRVFAALLFICYGTSVSSMFFIVIYRKGITAKNIVGFVFFSYTTSCTICFLNIAQKWPNLMNFWWIKENRFLSHPYSYSGFKLSQKIRWTAVAVISLGFLEHALFLANAAFSLYKKVQRCNWTVEAPLSYFLEHQFDFMFYFIPFYLPFGICAEVLNVTLTFGWNYMELFVMMISLGLVTRFEQINDKVKEMHGKIFPETVWTSIRSDYVEVCELLERVDHDLRFLILLSNINNLYFICFQLLNIYDTLPHLISYIYFWYSLAYLFGRTLTAQFLAARIHDASNYPLEVLKAVPYQGWSIEVQRFIDQIRSQTMALSGYKFFYLTRQSILAMLATIVTYELVLLQFDNDTKQPVDEELQIDECSG